MPSPDEEPSKLSMKRLLLKIAGPNNETSLTHRRPLWSHSVTLASICFLVGLVAPAILIASVAYFQKSLVVVQGCHQTNDSADSPFTFSCDRFVGYSCKLLPVKPATNDQDSFSLTKVAIIIACAHIAVGAICMPTVWQLARRWARRQLDKLEEKQVKEEAGEVAVTKKRIKENRKKSAKEEERLSRKKGAKNARHDQTVSCS